MHPPPERDTCYEHMEVWSMEVKGTRFGWKKRELMETEGAEMHKVMKFLASPIV